MHKYILFIFSFQAFIVTQHAYAGFERTAQPTSTLGRAQSGAAMFNESNLWINPASLSSITSFRSSIFYSPSPFQLSQLTNYGMLLANDFQFLKAGAAVSSFGFSLYRETVGSIALANNEIKNFGFGASISFNHLQITNYGSSTSIVLDVGMIYSVIEEVNLGISLQNVNGTSLGADDDIPQTIVTGIMYNPITTAIVNIDFVKDVRYKPTLRVGIEFSPHEVLTLRTGIQGEPSRLFGGIGIDIKPITIDYSVVTHSDLGLTHSIGISFSQ